MRFAFKTNPQMTTWEEILPVWQAGDELDVFEGGWVFDHFQPISGNDPTGPCLEGWTLLAALAQATHRLRLGVMVTGVVYRHPAVLANMAATVDIVSGGRLDLGLGAAWNERECGEYGIELGTPRERVDRFEEAVEVITRLLSSTTTTYEGRYFQLTDARCEPKSVQRPWPPLTIGAAGPRMLKITARVAAHWNTMAAEPEQWAARRAQLLEACEAVGRDPEEITQSVMTPLLPGQDPRELADKAVRFGEVGADLVVVNLPNPLRPDVLEQLGEALAPLA